MTNKRLFAFIFLALCGGLIGSINVIYNHIRDNPYNIDQEVCNVDQLNNKLKSAESQIRLIVNENNSLRKEIDRLKGDINELAFILKQYGTVVENDAIGKQSDHA